MSILKTTSRRQFLGQSAAAAAVSSLPLGALAQHAPMGDIVKRYIPGTHEALPVVGVGAPDVFISYREEGGKELSQQVLQAMIDMGGRLCDTPASFRDDMPDPVFGEMMDDMGGIQDELFLTTKISLPHSATGRAAGIADAERAFRYLDKDPIDMMFVHNMHDMEHKYPIVKDYKAEGRARYIGVSRTRTTDFTELREFMINEEPDVVLLGYSIYQQGPAEQEVMAVARDLGIAMIAVEAFKAGEDGALFGKVAGVEVPDFAKEYGIETWAQFSLKWILGDPAITAVVTETSRPHHVVDNMTAAFGEYPDQATRKKMSDFLLALG